jgi:hypothetical protein
MQASAKVTRNPRGVVGVLELAARMLPDVIFLISDASFQWKEGGSLSDVPWKEIARIVKARCKAPRAVCSISSASR